MKCSIFSQNKMQLINEPASQILVLSKMAGQVQLGCQVELVAYIFALGFISALSFMHASSKALSGPHICAG